MTPSKTPTTPWYEDFAATPRRRPFAIDAAALTERQRAVLEHLGSGLSVDETAAAMNLTRHMVDHAKITIMDQLTIHSRSELTQAAIDAGVVLLVTGPRLDIKIQDYQSLTPREKEVFFLRAQGMPMKDLAAALGLSVNTVADHEKAIFMKMDLHNVSGAVRVWEALKKEADRRLAEQEIVAPRAVDKSDATCAPMLAAPANLINSADTPTKAFTAPVAAPLISVHR